MKILQSWDDGVVDDIGIVKILKKYKATATFNINPGLNKNERVWGWKYGEKDVWRLGNNEMIELYNGFEIASHSLTHPKLTEISPQLLKIEVEQSRSILQDMFNQSVNGFCYPFNEFNEEVKDALRNGGYTHSRGPINLHNYTIPDDPFEFNPHCHFLDNDFLKKFEQAKQNNSPFFFFWGHSFEILNDDMWYEFEQKISRLSSDVKIEWGNISEWFPE